MCYIKKNLQKKFQTVEWRVSPSHLTHWQKPVHQDTASSIFSINSSHTTILYHHPLCGWVLTLNTQQLLEAKAWAKLSGKNVKMQISLLTFVATAVRASTNRPLAVWHHQGPTHQTTLTCDTGLAACRVTRWETERVISTKVRHLPWVLHPCPQWQPPQSPSPPSSSSSSLHGETSTRPANSEHTTDNLG